MIIICIKVIVYAPPVAVSAPLGSAASASSCTWASGSPAATCVPTLSTAYEELRCGPAVFLPYSQCAVDEVLEALAVVGGKLGRSDLLEVSPQVELGLAVVGKAG